MLISGRPAQEFGHGIEKTKSHLKRTGPGATVAFRQRPPDIAHKGTDVGRTASHLFQYLFDGPPLQVLTDYPDPRPVGGYALLLVAAAPKDEETVFTGSCRATLGDLGLSDTGFDLFQHLRAQLRERTVRGFCLQRGGACAFLRDLYPIIAKSVRVRERVAVDVQETGGFGHEVTELTHHLAPDYLVDVVFRLFTQVHIEALEHLRVYPLRFRGNRHITPDSTSVLPAIW